MCGLWGVVGNTIGKNEIACFRDLGLISSLRGLDSTGITVVSKAKKNKWNVEYYKDATDSTNFLFYNKKTHNLLENTRNVFAIMGHARAATIGNVTADNAHPFHVGNIVGMHNGTIFSLGNKNKTDSQHLYENIAEHGIQKALNDINGSAAYALTWVNAQTSTLHILRNNQRSLWCMLEKSGNLMFYASEKSFLDLINERSTRIFHAPHAVAEDTLFTLKFGEIKLEKEEVRRRVVVPASFSRVVKDGDYIPANQSVVPVQTVGPPFVPSSIPEGPALAVRHAAPDFEVEYDTERDKFDPCHEVFPQKPHAGYPFKVHLRHPDLPSKFLKILRFNDFYGRYRAPAEIGPILDQGCIISGVKATLNDTLYWIAPDMYVMPWHKDDSFVKETLQAYELKQPKMARACYASAIALHKHAQSMAARAVEQNNTVHIN